MGKKERPPVAPAPLKHSPFAALAARGAQVQPAQAEPQAQLAKAGPELAVAETTADDPTAATDAPPGRGGAPAALPSVPASSAPRSEAPRAPPHEKSRGRLVQRRETKHRAGRAVIVVSGFEALRDFDASALETLAKELKQALGCGGTLEMRAGQRELVLQGDRPAQVAALLRARGFRVDGVTR